MHVPRFWRLQGTNYQLKGAINQDGKSSLVKRTPIEPVHGDERIVDHSEIAKRDLMIKEVSAA